MRLTELEMVFSGNDRGFDGAVVLHGILPSEKLVESYFVELELVSKNEDESVRTFTPRPNHVVNISGLAASEEARSAFL